MNVVTNVGCNGIAPQEILDDLLRLYGIRLIGGMGEFTGKTFRIGHGGLQATRRNLVPTLFGIEESLRKKGLVVPLGSSLTGIERLPV
jgi:aspartate aminotransferase-like enzyme